MISIRWWVLSNRKSIDPYLYEIIRQVSIKLTVFNIWRRCIIAFGNGGSKNITNLHHRNKWRVSSTPIYPGNLGLIKEENDPPLQWKLGHIACLLSRKDGVTGVLPFVFTSAGEISYWHLSPRGSLISVPYCNQQQPPIWKQELPRPRKVLQHITNAYAYAEPRQRSLPPPRHTINYCQLSRIYVSCIFK